MHLRYEYDATTKSVAERVGRGIDAVYKALNRVHVQLLNCIRRTLAMQGRINVALAEGDRFLTLITTDGGDADGPAAPHRATDSDWCVFAEPVLELIPAAGAIGVARSETTKEPAN